MGTDGEMNVEEGPGSAVECSFLNVIEMGKCCVKGKWTVVTLWHVHSCRLNNCVLRGGIVVLMDDSRIGLFGCYRGIVVGVRTYNFL